jgi:hypothetical protein
MNTLCRQKVELLNVKLAVHIVTTGLYIKTVNLTRPSPSKLIHERKESPKLCLYHFYALLLHCNWSMAKRLDCLSRQLQIVAIW